MTLRGFLVRFTLIYIALLLLIGAAFHLLGARAGSSGNFGALIGAVMGSCLWFGRANQRYFSAAEKRSAVVGMAVVDAVLQVGIAVLALGGFGAAGDTAVMGLVLAFVIGLHALVIWYFTGWMGKQLAREATAKP